MFILMNISEERKKTEKISIDSIMYYYTIVCQSFESLQEGRSVRRGQFGRKKSSPWA
jgi:hypothetical protein